MDTEELIFSDKFIGDEKINDLCEQLKSVKKKRLLLRGNNLGRSGAQTVADFLDQNSSVVFLSMEWNFIGSQGADCLARALTANHTLTHLDLKNNTIGSDGAMALADSLKVNMTLTTLDLRWNKIDDQGALSFKYALLERRPRLQLLISGNLVSESVLSTLSAWMTKEEQQVAPLPKTPEVPAEVQRELLSKDLLELKAQISQLHGTIADLQRQLGGSLLRVTELEQVLSREQYKNAQLDEQYQHTSMRLSILIDEKAAFVAAWEKERAELVAEAMKMMQEKEAQAKDAILQRETLQDQHLRLQDEHEQLKIQSQHWQDQLATERERNLEELKLLRTRLTEYSLSESQMKADTIALTSEKNRQAERIKTLEEEVRLRRDEAQREIAAVQTAHEEDIKRLQDNHLQAMQALMEKNAILTKDITNLQAIICTLREELDNQKRELEEAYEGALRACRQSEQERAESQLRELRQRIDLLTAAKGELEVRCNQLVGELSQQQKEHQETMSRVTAQLTSMQDELQRLREQNSTMRTQLTAQETQVKTQALEMKDLQRRLDAVSDEAQKWSSEAKGLQASKVKLELHITKLQDDYAQLKANRVMEYATIRQNIVSAVASQFEHMRVDLNILDAVPK